ncbi:zinc finger protein [Reticulomyxa filosa]|uniref:Zinc finger protein n=1 Tax=Reticulomyxa filosa TaxID=46433 RepID=X6LRH4_RETFI|nr:zinc finger protein [Reticulomyxa filosa]|eukprot:ETO04234.1 zinc finger protein [Reticulomyxa filosa]
MKCELMSTLGRVPLGKTLRSYLKEMISSSMNMNKILYLLILLIEHTHTTKQRNRYMYMYILKKKKKKKLVQGRNGCNTKVIVPDDVEEESKTNEDVLETNVQWEYPSCKDLCQQLMDSLTGCSNLPTLTSLVRRYSGTDHMRSEYAKSLEASLLANLNENNQSSPVPPTGDDAALDTDTKTKNTNYKKNFFNIALLLEPPLTKQAMNSMSNASILNHGHPKKTTAAQNLKQHKRVPTEDIREKTNNKYSKDGGNMYCGLCLEKYFQNDLVIEVSMCKHYFHQECLLGWFARHNECPVCKIKGSTKNWLMTVKKCSTKSTLKYDLQNEKGKEL